MGAALAGEGEALAILRRQLATCAVTARRNTGVGFYADLLPAAEAPSAQLSSTELQIQDVYAEVDALENGAGFVVYIESGRLAMLEGFAFDEPWPSVISTFSVKYTHWPRCFDENANAR